MTPVEPISVARRSAIWRLLAAAGAQFEAEGDYALATGFGLAKGEEGEIARRMGMADLSPLPRTGFKGSGTGTWLRSRKLVLPDAPNRATPQRDGALVAMLSWQEYLVLGDIAARSPTVSILEKSAEEAHQAGCYHLPRRDSHAWFLLTGARVCDMLPKLCGIDLRPLVFVDGMVAQTSLARINVILIRADLATCPAVHLLADGASAGYLWPVLLDAMREFEGRAVGAKVIRSLK